MIYDIHAPMAQGWNEATATIWGAVHGQTSALQAVEQAFDRLSVVAAPESNCDEMSRLRAATALPCRSIVQAWISGSPLTPDVLDAAYVDFGTLLQAELDVGDGYLPDYDPHVRREHGALLVASLLARKRDPNLFAFTSLYELTRNPDINMRAPQLDAIYTTEEQTYRLPMTVVSGNRSSRPPGGSVIFVAIGSCLRSIANRDANLEALTTAELNELATQCVADDALGVALEPTDAGFLEQATDNLHAQIASSCRAQVAA